MSDWKQIHSHESAGGFGEFGVRVEAKIGRDLTNDEKWMCDKFSEDLLKLFYRTNALADPNTAEEKAEIHREFRAAFGDAALLMEEIPNEYCRDFCCLGRPWFIVTTPAGRMKVGWRKRVIVLDWYESQCPETAATLFPEEDTTKEGQMIHAWGYEKLKQYVARILAPWEE